MTAEVIRLRGDFMTPAEKPEAEVYSSAADDSGGGGSGGGDMKEMREKISKLEAALEVVKATVATREGLGDAKADLSKQIGDLKGSMLTATISLIVAMVVIGTFFGWSRRDQSSHSGNSAPSIIVLPVNAAVQGVYPQTGQPTAPIQPPAAKPPP